MEWIRARFKANADDYRPVKWPPVGPYWCTGYTFDDSHAIVVAYVRSEDQIAEYWPEAEEAECEERDKITFTERFPKPEWWTEQPRK